MVWARFDDRYSESPKIEAAGPWAELLDVRAIIYSARNETDGHISVVALGRISINIPNPKGKAAKLVEVGRWKPNEDGGWFIHDFLEYNPSKAQLADQRAEGKERAKRSREAKQKQPRSFAVGSGDLRARAPGREVLEEMCGDDVDQAGQVRQVRDALRAAKGDRKHEPFKDSA
jgi:hypothetical protein